MKLSDINIRDPYVVADSRTKKYYMYASSPSFLPKGFCVYVSENLLDWSDPVSVFEASEDFWATEDFWAPEVHPYRGKYYLFGTFSSQKRVRTSQILEAESLMGPFKVHSKPLAPHNWYALDATLYIKGGKPFALFSHEWLQTYDGEMCCVQLSDDLTEPIGETNVLFKASESGWAKTPVWSKHREKVFIVDAPFVFNIDGVEFMLWSSWSREAENGYSVGVAYPADGDVLSGRYRHELLELPKKDSGHAMVFKDFEGNFRIAYHENNCHGGNERAAIYYVKIENGEVRVYEDKETFGYFAYDRIIDSVRGGIKRVRQQ